MTDALLSIEGLSVQFRTRAGTVRAVDEVSYEVPKGRTVAVVGESGCGKSVTALSILRLIELGRGEIAAGRVLFEGIDLLQLSNEAMRQVRGNRIAMIFQEPMTSLNPVYRVGDQVGEAIRLHRGLSEEETSAEVLSLLSLVGIPSPEQRINEYPHQLSGGMRQRVMIAMALACRPQLLIADEPTTALDVTIQAQILNLVSRLQRQLDMSVLLITHDLGVVASVARDMVVMYAGRVVERGSVRSLFARPRHPYTAGLLASLPTTRGPRRRLQTIDGNVPDALHFPDGCRFHPRCPFALPRCAAVVPKLEVRLQSGERTHSACHFVDDNPEVDLLPFGRGAS